jgi:hypothetical protein
LSPKSPAADPFFLEQRLALELRHLRLMSHIVPILVGVRELPPDFVADAETVLVFLDSARLVLPPTR